MFLVNVTIFIILSDEVIQMFYDLLALEFIQELDDVGFILCKMDVFGKRLQRATLTPFFNVEFKKVKVNSGMDWRIKVFLKWAYFINLAVGLTVMIYVTFMQKTGSRQCATITISSEYTIAYLRCMPMENPSQQCPLDQLRIRCGLMLLYSGQITL